MNSSGCGYMIRLRSALGTLNGASDLASMLIFFFASPWFGLGWFRSLAHLRDIPDSESDAWKDIRFSPLFLFNKCT